MLFNDFFFLPLVTELTAATRIIQNYNEHFGIQLHKI